MNISRKDRRIAARKAAKVAKARKLASLTLVGATALMPFASMGAAVAAPSSHSQEAGITVPVLKDLSLEAGTLRGVFLADKGNPSPLYEITVTPAEDSSALPSLEKALATAKENYDILKAGLASTEATLAAWNNVRLEIKPDGTTTVFLNNGKTERFGSEEEARDEIAYQTSSAFAFLAEYDRAEKAFNMASNAVANFVPTPSNTEYVIEIDATKSGYQGAIHGANLYNGSLNGLWEYQLGGFVEVSGAEGVFQIIENNDGVMKLSASFPSPTQILEGRATVDMLQEESPETPDASGPETHTLPHRAESVQMPYFGSPAKIDLSSGKAIEGVEIALESGGFGTVAYSGFYDFRVDGTALSILPAWDHDERETVALSYRIWDAEGTIWTGSLSVEVAPSGTPTGLLPIPYDPSDSRTAYVDATLSLGTLSSASKENSNLYNFDTGRLLNAAAAYGTPDAARGYQGQRIALKPTANDAAGPRTGMDSYARIDPNSQREVFAYETLQIKNPATGLWTSAGYNGSTGKVSILPAEGTESGALAADNPFAEPVIAFDPYDKSGLVSEQTDYRIGVVAYGETVDDPAAFWANAQAGDFISSTATFGITEWAAGAPGIVEEPYCFLPDSLPDSILDREHGEALSPYGFRRSNASPTGTAAPLRFCSPVGQQDEATVKAGETVMLDVLANDKHFSATDGLVQEEKAYDWDRESLRLINASGDAVMELETDLGRWAVSAGQLSFTAKADGLIGEHTDAVRYAASQIWVGDPATQYPHFDSMTKRQGATITGIAANVLIRGAEAPEVPETPAPEVPTPEVPETPTPEVPEVPTPEVPEVPTPEVPETETVVAEEVPELETAFGEEEGVTETGAEKPAGLLAGLVAMATGIGLLLFRRHATK